MQTHAGRTWDADELGQGFGELAREAMATGPVTVTQPGGDDLIVIGKTQLQRDYRLTPQAYVRSNRVSQEASDLLDEVTAEIRANHPSPFGI